MSRPFMLAGYKFSNGSIVFVVHVTKVHKQIREQTTIVMNEGDGAGRS